RGDEIAPCGLVKPVADRVAAIDASHQRGERGDFGIDDRSSRRRRQLGNAAAPAGEEALLELDRPVDRLQDPDALADRHELAIAREERLKRGLAQRLDIAEDGNHLGLLRRRIRREATTTKEGGPSVKLPYSARHFFRTLAHRRSPLHPTPVRLARGARLP